MAIKKCGFFAKWRQFKKKNYFSLKNRPQFVYMKKIDWPILIIVFTSPDDLSMKL